MTKSLHISTVEAVFIFDYFQFEVIESPDVESVDRRTDCLVNEISTVELVMPCRTGL